VAVKNTKRTVIFTTENKTIVVKNVADSLSHVSPDGELRNDGKKLLKIP
jgi:hypothetical protein